MMNILDQLPRWNHRAQQVDIQAEVQGPALDIQVFIRITKHNMYFTYGTNISKEEKKRTSKYQLRN